MKKRLGARKAAPRKAKKAAMPAQRAAKKAKTAKPAQRVAKKAKAVKKPAPKRATEKRASRASKPPVQKAVKKPAQAPVQKRVEANVEARTPVVEKRPFWGFLGFGRKQKAKVSLMDLQGKK